MCEDCDQHHPPTPSGGSSDLDKDHAYQLALVKIEYLEKELRRKDQALEANLLEQIKLREGLQDCIKVIEKSSRQLLSVKSEIRKDSRRLLDRIAELEQELKTLESSNDAWTSRAIALEFELLTAHKEIEALKNIP